MSRFKDFDAALAEYAGEPITFKLGGQEWTVNSVGAETFLTFIRKASNGGDAMILAFADFVDEALPADDREPFHEMVATSNIPIKMLMDIAKWVVEQAAGNPTEDASSSEAPASKRGRRPRVVSLSAASPSKGRRSAAG